MFAFRKPILSIGFYWHEKKNEIIEQTIKIKANNCNTSEIFVLFYTGSLCAYVCVCVFVCALTVAKPKRLKFLRVFNLNT